MIMQYALNWVLLADMALSTLLGGYPRDTVSQRLSRARAAGVRPACVMCAVLTWIGRRIFGDGYDHCTYATDPSTPSTGRQVWNWGGPDT